MKIVVKLGFAFAFALVAVPVACDRVEPKPAVDRRVLPGVPIDVLLNEPSFIGTVVESYISTVPANEGTGEVGYVSVELTREDGTHFAITATHASQDEMNAAGRLTSGRSYRFPEALKLSRRK